MPEDLHELALDLNADNVIQTSRTNFSIFLFPLHLIETFRLEKKSIWTRYSEFRYSHVTQASIRLEGQDFKVKLGFKELQKFKTILQNWQ